MSATAKRAIETVKKAVELLARNVGVGLSLALGL
jgi:hypothetical protein